MSMTGYLELKRECPRGVFLSDATGREINDVQEIVNVDISEWVSTALDRGGERNSSEVPTARATHLDAFAR